MSTPEQPEEDLNLTGPAPKKKGNGGNTPPATTAAPGEPEDGENESLKIGARLRKLEIAPGASDQDVLARVLADTSEEKLFIWEMCMLPSGGIYYGWQDGVIQVRPMTQTAEKALATQRLAQSGQSVDLMLKECCRFPKVGSDDFDPMNLLLGDRMFLIYYLRGITHGNLYEFATSCPNPECQSLNTHTYDLNELAQTIKRADPTLGKEPFRVVLPYLSQATDREFYISVRFLRGIDGNTMLANRKRKQTSQAHAARANANPLQRKQIQAKKMQSVDDSINDGLEQVIVNVMGNDDPSVIHRIVNQLHASDTAAIRDWLREYTPGIDTTIEIFCPECDRKFTVEIPITETFFRPKSKRAS